MKNSNEETVANILSSQQYLPEITEKEIVCGKDVFTSYGLKIKRNDGTVDVYEDISLTRTKITELYDLFCNYDIDESHIEEVICDFVDSLHSI
ncbi:MAG: hypothetical protein E7621_03835 [Ruminococcaceae bacterium]|nr:hypothetical protein [Oscillospiraceae bacterium]